jgi:molybdopterin synthase catalytic subunit
MQTRIHFTSAPLVIPPMELPHREIGACVEFHGIVRELEEGAPLSGLYYEAYEPMAARQMERIFTELAAAHDCMAVIFIHRVGWVGVGETSVYLRVMASHRGPALTFCEAAINRMKADAPIWKRTAAPEGC